MIYMVFGVITTILLISVLMRIINYNIMNNNLAFLSLTTLLLLTSNLVFFLYFKNYLFSIVNSSVLIIFSIMLVLEIKKILGNIPKIIFPYIIYIVYIFISILITFIKSI